MVSLAHYHRQNHHHDHYRHRGLIRPSGTHGGGTCAHSPCRVEREAAGEAPDQGQEVVGVVPGQGQAVVEEEEPGRVVAAAVGRAQAVVEEALDQG